MSTWAIEAAQRDSEREQIALLRMRKALQDREIFIARGKALWTQWRSLLRPKAEEFNKQPGKRDTLSVEADTQSCRIWLTKAPRFSVSGAFDGESLRFKGSRPVNFEAVWRIVPTEDRLDVWIADPKDAPATLEPR
jgi:hypothetical protein